MITTITNMIVSFHSENFLEIQEKPPLLFFVYLYNLIYLWAMENKYIKKAFVLLLFTLFLGLMGSCQQIGLMPNDGFWYTWDTDDALLYDDGYQGNYANNGLGALTIYPLTPGTITLSFLFMDIEENASCSWDYLEVYHGENFDSLVSRYCGTELPPIMTSTDPTGSFTLLWSTDFSVPRPGFIIEIKNGGFALPIVLENFIGYPSGQGVKLEWSVLSEVNNDYFTIHRSIDCYHWEELGRVPGNGNHNNRMEYSFTDESPLLGISYYRLTQTDYDGNYEMFRPISVIIRGESKEVWKTVNMSGQEVGPNYRGAVLDIYYDYTSKKRIQ